MLGLDTKLEATSSVDCGADPIASLVEMFVAMVQAGRIARGQCPALRPVFLKPHGVAHGTFRVRPDLPERAEGRRCSPGRNIPHGFAFRPTRCRPRTTSRRRVGIGIKLFGVPVPKIFGAPQRHDFDFILQNFDVFFVDTAADMCEFTKAGVVDGDYDPYLDGASGDREAARRDGEAGRQRARHAYWSCMPVRVRRRPVRQVQARAERSTPTRSRDRRPTRPISPPISKRAAEGGRGALSLHGAVQHRSRDDAARQGHGALGRSRSARRSTSPISSCPQQDVAARGQAEYGENLACNIWRVTEDHEPQGSIADGAPRGLRGLGRAASQRQRRADRRARRAEARRSIRRLRRQRDRPRRDPSRRSASRASATAQTEFFIGPEVVDPAPQPPGLLSRPTGALKRQAARFRIYGYNAARRGRARADRRQRRHRVDRAPREPKAQWYQFQAALDIPEAAAMSVPRAQRRQCRATAPALAIDPGPRTHQRQVDLRRRGASCSTPASSRARRVRWARSAPTTPAGCSSSAARGSSASPSGAPVFNPADPNSFNNADDWYDDIVRRAGHGRRCRSTARAIPVEARLGRRRAAELCARHRRLAHAVRPAASIRLRRNAAGCACPTSLRSPTTSCRSCAACPTCSGSTRASPRCSARAARWTSTIDDFIARLAHAARPGRQDRSCARAAAQVIFNSFRPPQPTVSEPAVWPHVWPWIYGDAFGSFAGRHAAATC